MVTKVRHGRCSDRTNDRRGQRRPPPRAVRSPVPSPRRAGGTPLQEARVIVIGTSLFATTGPDGKFTIRRVPAGTAKSASFASAIRNRKSPFASSTARRRRSTSSMTHVGRATAGSRHDGHRRAAPSRSRQRGREHLGREADRERARSAPSPTCSTARVPGVMVQQGTQTGAGQRIRVRGISCLSLSNEPIYVIDGIRMSSNNGSTAFGNGGSELQPTWRHQPGRHREHRDREGTVGRDAVRHRRRERRHRHHDEEGPRGHRPLDRRTLKAAFSTTATGTPTTTRSPAAARPARS